MVTSICPSHAAPVGDLWGHKFCQVLVGCACPLTGNVEVSSQSRPGAPTVSLT